MPPCEPFIVPLVFNLVRPAQNVQMNLTLPATETTRNEFVRSVIRFLRSSTPDTALAIPVGPLYDLVNATFDNDLLCAEGLVTTEDRRTFKSEEQHRCVTQFLRFVVGGMMRCNPDLRSHCFKTPLRATLTDTEVILPFSGFRW